MVRVFVAGGLLVALGVLLAAPAAMAHPADRCVDTSTATPEEVTVESAPGGGCHDGPAIPGSGILGRRDARRAGVSPNRIDAGAGGDLAGTAGQLSWTVPGAALAFVSLRRRRRP